MAIQHLSMGFRDAGSMPAGEAEAGRLNCEGGELSLKQQVELLS